MPCKLCVARVGIIAVHSHGSFRPLVVELVLVLSLAIGARIRVRVRVGLGFVLALA